MSHLKTAISLLAYKIDKSELRTLWYENEEGDKWVPDFDKNEPDFPEDPDYKYQVSQFPNQLQTTWLLLINQDEVDACLHKQEDLKDTYGWEDGIEGRECLECGGTQTRKVGEPWPDEWDGYGSTELMVGYSGWQEDLVLNMANSGDFTLSEAIIVAATSCERCMNSLAHDYGLDWGYKEESEEWEKCGTECDFCRHMPYKRSESFGAEAMSEEEITKICMYCKKVLKEGLHGQDPKYVSHGVCDECLAVHYPDFDEEYKQEEMPRN